MGDAREPSRRVHLPSRFRPGADTMPNAFCAGILFVSMTGLFFSVFMVTAMTALQLRVPDSLRGRVMGLHGAAFNLMVLGALFTGALATLIGAAAALAVGVVIVMAASASILVTQREVRGLDGRAIPETGPT